MAKGEETLEQLHGGGSFRVFPGDRDRAANQVRSREPADSLLEPGRFRLAISVGEGQDAAACSGDGCVPRVRSTPTRFVDEAHGGEVGSDRLDSAASPVIGDHDLEAERIELLLQKRGQAASQTHGILVVGDDDADFRDHVGIPDGPIGRNARCSIVPPCRPQGQAERESRARPQGRQSRLRGRPFARVTLPQCGA